MDGQESFKYSDCLKNRPILTKLKKRKCIYFTPKTISSAPDFLEPLMKNITSVRTVQRFL